MSYLFYVEHENIDSANVIAVCKGKDGKPKPIDGRADVCTILAACEYYPNAPVHVILAPIDYLESGYCRQVSEEEARCIHPRLFIWLDKKGIR